MDHEHSDHEKWEQIVNAGWRQGSLFKLPAGIVPDHIGYDPENELLILATQSCTVVSHDFEKDPWIEAMVAYPRTEYNERDGKARGQNVRAFVLPLLSHCSQKAVECDLNRRFFLGRQCLVQYPPLSSLVIPADARRSFAGWIGRSYTRIELPDVLVERMRPVFEKIKKALKKNPDSMGPLHERILHVYIQWSPDGELTSLETPYKIDLLFLCDDPDTAEHLDKELSNIYAGTDQGILLTMNVQVTSETLVVDLAPYVRLSQWDYLSNLGDLGENPLGL